MALGSDFLGGGKVSGVDKGGRKKERMDWAGS